MAFQKKALFTLSSLLFTILMMMRTFQSWSDSSQDSEKSMTFENAVKGFTDEQKTAIESKMEKNCPVGLKDLRMVYVAFFGFDGKEHQGTLIVNKSVAKDILKVFKTLHDKKFPMERMDAINALPDTDLSYFSQDNTVAFHCRKERFSIKWSQHAYGLAVDLNPVENPFIHHAIVSPPDGKEFVERSDVRPGMIIKNGNAYKAFSSIGWKWGGNWHNPKDYMHFSQNGH